uniref:Uncharacterized protein n=1 Tax=Anguilla anguilla TaxID=7936 RepID=A0A0E9R2Y6_ANGAN
MISREHDLFNQNRTLLQNMTHVEKYCTAFYFSKLFKFNDFAFSRNSNSEGE